MARGVAGGVRSLTALIVDDEPLARERIRTLLAGEPDVTVVGECGDGLAAVDAVRRSRPDLVFLDVQMSGLDGFDVIDAVGPDRFPAVVFVTAHDRYALRAFDVHALDYLLKPFDRARFLRTLERARSRLRGGGRDGPDRRLMALMERLRDAPRRPPRLLVREGGRVVFVTIHEIDYVEACGNYVRLHVGSVRHLLRDTLGGLESRLDPRRFVRIHRSTIVNLDRVKELQPLFHGDYQVLLTTGAHLVLSRTYRDKLERALGHSL